MCSCTNEQNDNKVFLPEVLNTEKVKLLFETQNAKRQFRSDNYLVNCQIVAGMGVKALFEEKMFQTFDVKVFLVEKDASDRKALSQKCHLL